MQLIGMLDSPYVRRSAISLRMLEIPFEHRAVSVFRHFDEFQRINPAVKAPTLVCDDGTVLMDSNLILAYAEDIAAEGRTLMPHGAGERLRVYRVLGLALAACEKSISIIYERQLRPLDKQHEPWIERVTGQLLAACSSLEKEFHDERNRVGANLQSGITSAVTWRFLQAMVPEVVVAGEYPAWAAFSAEAETIPAFSELPHE